MKNFVVIRPMQPSDDFNCQNVIKEYVMSFANDAFISCLFREITIQLCVLVWAIMFIFFGFPLLVCFWAIPGVILFLYISVKGAYYNKAIELAGQNPDRCWVAEAYEPHFLRCDPKDMDYKLVAEEQLPALMDTNPSIRQLRKQIVGTIGVREHQSLHNCGWLSRTAVNPRYSMDRIGEHLINQVLSNCLNRGYYTVETVTTECQYGIRELMLRMGFTMKQIYHKPIIAHVKVMKSQLGIDLATWAAPPPQSQNL